MLVYIREAHAVDSAWPIPTIDGKIVEESQTLAERVQCASHCVDALALRPIPTLVDDLGDTAERAYEAWPDRLFVIDVEGRVAFRSPPGPFGFDLEQLEKAIQRELERDRDRSIDGKKN